MKKLKNIVAVFSAAITILAAGATGANAEWRASGSNWWYSEGSSYAVGWKQIDGQWYYFDSNGYMVTGWMCDDNGNWYYFYSNGMMAHDCNIGGYYLNSNGVWTSSSSNGGKYSSGSSYNDNQSQTAYLSATGSKYHSIPNCGKMNPNKATQTTVSDAEARGYERCTKCW